MLLMQALHTLATPEEKLAALCKKYADLVSTFLAFRADYVVMKSGHPKCDLTPDFIYGHIQHTIISVIHRWVQVVSIRNITESLWLTARREPQHAEASEGVAEEADAGPQREDPSSEWTQQGYFGSQQAGKPLSGTTTAQQEPEGATPLFFWLQIDRCLDMSWQAVVLNEMLVVNI